MCSISASDIRSNLARNCYHLEREFGNNPWKMSVASFKKTYMYYKVPESDSWQPALLSSLLFTRYEIDAMGENTNQVNQLIESLCVS